jgi:hypothetical protein
MRRLSVVPVVGLAAALIAIAGCGQSGGDSFGGDGGGIGGGGGSGASGGGGTGLVGPDDPYSREPADVQAALDTVYGASCSRLHGDCSELCDDPYIFCGGSVQECVDHYGQMWISDMQYPAASQALAQECADQVDGRPCLGLIESTVACDYFVTESCGQDGGAGLSPLHATEVTLPDIVDTPLCDGRTAWYTVDLAAAETVTLSLQSEIAYQLSADLGRLATNAKGQAIVETIGVNLGFFAGNVNEESFSPAPDAGSFLIMLDDATTETVSVAISSDLHP